MDLDQAIDQSYREASDAEASARRLGARIEQIPGAKGLLSSRNYRNHVNFKAIQENLTLASLISRSDAALAHYCGLDASVKHRIDEQKEARAMAAKACRCAQSASERPTNVPPRLVSSSSSVASTQ